MKLISITLVCLGSIAAGAQTTLIPDPAFEQALIDLGIDSGMPDGGVPTAAVETITVLSIANEGISDLTGIEDFAALETLHCDWNYLTTLDLSHNENLFILSCPHNYLTSLDISNSTNLFSLDCEANSLSVLNVSIFPGLQYLNCGVNNLAVLDVSDNPLVLLACYDNNITVLDVTNQPQLEILQCELNQISVLDLSGSPVLEFVNVGSNPLTSLDISGNPLVNEFLCSNTAVACLNVRNGNNENFLLFEALNNPSLNCIEVDDAVWANANWTDSVDVSASFSNFCNNACSSNQLGLNNESEDQFHLYPNPAKNVMQLSWETALAEEAMLSFIALNGQVLFTQLVAAGTKQTVLELPALSAGIYLVQVMQADRVVTKQLIVE